MSLPRLCRPLLRLRHHRAASIILRLSHSIAVRGLSTHAPPSTPLRESSSSSTLSPPTVDQRKLKHLKHSSRGGQDLSRRYQRLERSIRGKTSYGRGIEDFHRSGRVEDPAPYTNVQGSSDATGKRTRCIYRGFVVPEVPAPPADDGTSQSSVFAERAFIHLRNQNVACPAALSVYTTCMMRLARIMSWQWTSSATT